VATALPTVTVTLADPALPAVSVAVAVEASAKLA